MYVNAKPNGDEPLTPRVFTNINPHKKVLIHVYTIVKLSAIKQQAKAIS